MKKWKAVPKRCKKYDVLDEIKILNLVKCPNENIHKQMAYFLKKRVEFEYLDLKCD